MRRILGLSCDYHDAAAALVVDGAIVAAAEQERFSRRKHDASLPVDAVRSCLDLGGIEPDDVTDIVFYEKPLVLAHRFLATKQRQGPAGWSGFVRTLPELVASNLVIGPRVASMMRAMGATRPPRLQFIEHHRSHASAAFHPSPFDHAAIVTADGIGEWATTSIARGAHHRITILEEQRFPNSLGLMYSFVTAFCGFQPNSDEYKLMGLAPFGTPRFQEELERLVDIDGNGGLIVDARALHWFGPRALRSQRLHDLFDGPPRVAGDPLTQREADLAATIQQFTETSMLRVAEHAHALTGEAKLCLAGGVALNSVANGRIAREGPFDEVWIQPAAGDAGSAIGAALSFWHDVLGRSRGPRPGPDAMNGGCLGPSIADDEIVSRLESLEIGHISADHDDDLAELVSARLAAGDIVGWFQGRMEFGPRALGARSILADPRRTDVRERLNLQTKGRESFRPFAPAVLASKAHEWFELDQASPYMLIVAPVREHHLIDVADEPSDFSERARIPRSTIPACTHIDGSARVQTVDDAAQPRFLRLLESFEHRSGCPILVNTSFNRAGEPIVNTVDEAIACAIAGQLDLLVLGSSIIDRASLIEYQTRSTAPAEPAAETRR